MPDNQTSLPWTMPADGWTQIVPPGEWPIWWSPAPPPAALTQWTQIIDDAALNSLDSAFLATVAANPGGLLVDYDHFSHAADKSSAAAGWLIAVENRGASAPTGGLWGQIRWTPAATAQIRAGEYRYLSPVFDPATVEKLPRNRLRPVKILSLAVTNAPNMSGIMPLANRAHRAQTQKEKNMEELKKLLGLPPEADDAAALAAVAELKKQASDAATPEDMAALENRVKSLEKDLVEADLRTYADRITDVAAMRTALLTNRAAALAVLLATVPAANTRSMRVLPNRATATIPDGGDQQMSRDRAIAIRNRANEMRVRNPALSFPAAFRAAEAEFQSSQA